jgi:hypothetical protein
MINLGPLTKNGYIRLGIIVGSFYFAVQALSPSNRMEEIQLTMQLQETAQKLATLGERVPPSSFNTLRSQGFISDDLQELCESSQVKYFPANATNNSEQPVFTIPSKEGQVTLHVSPSGFVRKVR